MRPAIMPNTGDNIGLSRQSELCNVYRLGLIHCMCVSIFISFFFIFVFVLLYDIHFHKNNNYNRYETGAKRIMSHVYSGSCEL